MKWIHRWWLRWQVALLSDVVAEKEALTADHTRRLAALKERLRQSRARLALIEDPQRMVDEALGGTR